MDWKQKRPEDFLDFSYTGFISISKMEQRLYELIMSKNEWLKKPEDYALSGDQSWYRNVYLQSDHWRGIRNVALLFYGNRCQKCKKHGGQEILDVHHISYEHLGFEMLEDLTVLCRECHDQEHED